MKLRPPRQHFVEKLPYRISWKSIELGRRWGNGLGLHRTFSFLSHNVILILTQIICLFIWWPTGHTGQSHCKAVGICGAAWGSFVRETPIWLVGFAILCQAWSAWCIIYTALSALSLLSYIRYRLPFSLSRPGIEASSNQLAQQNVFIFFLNYPTVKIFQVDAEDEGSSSFWNVVLSCLTIFCHIPGD